MSKSGSRDDVSFLALRNRILLTVEFVENMQGFRYGQGVRDAVESAVRKGSMRALQVIAREIDAMTISLTTDQRDGLEALLKQRLGIDKDAEREEQKRQIAGILRRGTIASEKERRRLEEYVDSLEALGGDPGEVMAIRALLRKA